MMTCYFFPIEDKGKENDLELKHVGLRRHRHLFPGKKALT
jgi:hypothetical protein